jgi:hypothetical protein
MTILATTLQAFFTDRLICQRQVSPHTLSAYRDTWRLLLVFASARRLVDFFARHQPLAWPSSQSQAIARNLGQSRPGDARHFVHQRHRHQPDGTPFQNASRP